MAVRLAPIIGISTFIIFVAAVWQRGATTPPGIERGAQVVVPAVVQVVLYGGDRFLAANVESVRAAVSGVALEGRDGSYRLRAHRVVSLLNPCHEDNYWIGNAALSFGGASDAGSELLGRASQCRFWDEMPPFLYGFNQRFFRLDVAKARKAIELAADRATINAAGFHQMAIMMTVNTIKDAQAALALLQFERDRARDPRLREMLELRIERVQGLLALREAQKKYERRFSKPLSDPAQLVQSGVLRTLPKDPLGLGYGLREGEFHLQQMQIDGLR